MSKEKEIIIDGVDVSKCKYYSKKQQIYQATRPLCIMKDCCMLSNSVKPCINNDCYFKQLRRLQEENKGLKEKIKDLDAMTGIFSVRLANKYKQALEEIRKWATNHNPCDIEADINCTKEDCFKCLNYDTTKITKIINEVFNDN